jgi:hypothetical protein
MEEHGDVTCRNSQSLAHVLARLLFEHSQRHDGPLDLAELFDALAQAHVLFGPRDEVVGGRSVLAGEGIDGQAVVRLRAEVPAATVACGVPHHRSEDAGPFLLGLGEFVAPRDVEQSAERVLKTVDRIFGRRPFCARKPDEIRTAGANDVGQPVEGVIHVGSSMGKVSTPADITYGER